MRSETSTLVVKNLLHIGISVAAIIIIIAGIATIKYFENNADKNVNLITDYADEKTDYTDLATPPSIDKNETADAQNKTSEIATSSEELKNSDEEFSLDQRANGADTISEDASKAVVETTPIIKEQKIVEEVKEEIVEEKTDCTGGGLSADFLCLINEYRASQGKNKLAYSGSLNSVALAHSKWMTSSGDFSHTGENGTSFSERCSSAGTPCDAENLALGANSASGLIEMWKASAIHNKNMLGSHTVAGLGRDGGYTTLLLY